MFEMSRPVPTSAARMYAADLTEAYVGFNKGDVTDPTTLGG